MGKRPVLLVLLCVCMQIRRVCGVDPNGRLSDQDTASVSYIAVEKCTKLYTSAKSTQFTDNELQSDGACL